MKFYTQLAALFLFGFTSSAYAQTDRQRYRQQIQPPTQTAPAPRRIAAPAPRSPAQQKAPSACAGMNSQACSTFHIVNQERQRKGLHALDAHQGCTRAAQAHADDMAARNYFAHNSPGETWQQRMNRFRLSNFTVAENLAKTTQGPDRAVELWIESPGHYKNLVGAQFESAGMGYRNGYYVQCFSGQRGQALR